MGNIRIRIVIRGAVQGVGFRPFVYRLAHSLALTGWVSNSHQGVIIEADGPKEQLDEFLNSLEQDRPPRASIQSLEYSFLEPAGFANFEIRSSDKSGRAHALILPDIATCSDCLADIFDPTNRRHLYPFTNCTNCGPRLTIIEGLPYDRGCTTMRNFIMCAECREEFEDPRNRRFHAQPNACTECGPHVELWDRCGHQIARDHDAILRTADAVRSGQIAAVKGLGGFHLIVDATNDAAVNRLRELKHREEKPFALMAPSMSWVHALCDVSPLEERLLSSPECPIVLLARWDHHDIAYSVAPRNPQLGVMLPYTPLHHILMSELRKPVVATSGNLTDEPIAIDEHEALTRLAHIADVFLVHNRPIRRHVDDSIVRVLLGREQVLRRARGYAPLPLVLKRSMPSMLAVGGHLKNTVAFATPGESAGETLVFVSQHIGDLETREALCAFRRVIDDFENLYDVRPSVLACDMHPDYASTRYATERARTTGLAITEVQHHWAHVTSCMAENELDSPVLGVSWDGTGYGLDGGIWGGEFLLAQNASFRRVGHFRPFALPGGDAAIKKPQHTAAGLLYAVFGEGALHEGLPRALRQMLRTGFRSPQTTSVGRLFDGVASIIGLRNRITFEGQAAMELEFAVDATINDSYPYAIVAGERLVVDWEPMIRAIVADIQDRTPLGSIAAKFHNALAETIVDVAGRVGQQRVVLTGGCFQNRYLTERAATRLADAGFKPFWHQRIPPNDGGIALGQVVAAGMTAGVEDRVISAAAILTA
jgi:hydrogenase maturation protein HypF